MRHVDFSPLYRSTVGFDRLFTMLDSLGAARWRPDLSALQHRAHRRGRLSHLHGGRRLLGRGDLDPGHRNVLTVKGERKEEAKDEGAEVLYRGIAARAFERRFQLADHVEVDRRRLKNGLLHIDLKRKIPEELKPRKIEIGNGGAKRQADRGQGRRLTVEVSSRRRSGAFGRRFFSCLPLAAQAISSPKRSTSSAVVAKLVTKRQRLRPAATLAVEARAALRQSMEHRAGVLQPFGLRRGSRPRRPRWPAAARRGAARSTRRCGRPAGRPCALAWRASLQPQTVLEIGVELRRDEARLGKELGGALADEGAGPAPVPDRTGRSPRRTSSRSWCRRRRGCRRRASRSSPPAWRRARPARWQSARRPCAAAGRALAATAEIAAISSSAVDRADLGRLGDGHRHRLPGMHEVRQRSGRSPRRARRIDAPERAVDRRQARSRR